MLLSSKAGNISHGTHGTTTHGWPWLAFPGAATWRSSGARSASERNDGIAMNLISRLPTYRRLRRVEHLLS